MAPIVAAKGMASGIGKRSKRTDSLKDVLVPLAREAGEGIGMAEACGVSQEGGWRQYNAKGGNRQDIGGGVKDVDSPSCFRYHNPDETAWTQPRCTPQ